MHYRSYHLGEDAASHVLSAYITSILNVIRVTLGDIIATRIIRPHLPVPVIHTTVVLVAVDDAVQVPFVSVTTTRP